MNIEFSHSKEFKYLIKLAILACLCLSVTRAFADSKHSLHGSGGVKTADGRVPLLEGSAEKRRKSLGTLRFRPGAEKTREID